MGPEVFALGSGLWPAWPGSQAAGREAPAAPFFASPAADRIPPG